MPRISTAMTLLVTPLNFASRTRKYFWVLAGLGSRFTIQQSGFGEVFGFGIEDLANMDKLGFYLQSEVKFHHNLRWVFEMYLWRFKIVVAVDRHNPMSGLLGDELGAPLEVGMGNRHRWGRRV